MTINDDDTNIYNSQRDSKITLRNSFETDRIIEKNKNEITRAGFDVDFTVPVDRYKRVCHKTNHLLCK